jgi:hypothetical protein
LEKAQSPCEEALVARQKNSTNMLKSLSNLRKKPKMPMKKHGQLRKNPKMPMKKPKQLKEKPQDAYEKAWATNIPKNPCNL